MIDEIKIPPSHWATAPRQVSIALTNECDLGCSHCFVSKHPAMLPYNQLQDWLYELDTHGCLGVGFGGGEPTLYPHLGKLCKFTAQHTRLAVTLTPHGHNLDHQMVESLAGNIHFIRVRMDGVETTYERIRGRSFNDLLQKFHHIRKLADFGVNYLVNAQTLSDLYTAATIAMDMGAKELLLLPELPTKHTTGIDQPTLFEFRNWVNRYKGSVSLTVSEAGAEGLPTCNPFEQETGLRSYAHINAKGLLKCSSFDSNGVPIHPHGLSNAITKLDNQYKGGAR